MQKDKLALLVIVAAIVAYIVLVRPRQAQAEPVTPPVSVAAPPPEPDLGAQLAQGAQALAAGATALAALPGQITAVGTQISMAAGQAVALPGQVGATIGQVGTQLTTTAQSIGQAVSAAGQQALSYVQPYLPYLGPAFAVGIIVTGIAQTRRRYDVVTKRCCDVNTLGMEFNCNTPTSGSIMRCMYEDASFPNVYAGQFNAAWPRERVVNFIFTELAQWYGKVQAGRVSEQVRSGGTGGYRTVWHYTDIGLSQKPALATDIAPNEFRILNADEIAQYRAIKAQIIAHNKTLIGVSKVVRPAKPRSCITMKISGTNVCTPAQPALVTDKTKEFLINWLY